MNVRNEAIILRRKGYTYKEIMDELKVSKSTLSGWVHVEIDEEENKQIRIITAKKGLKKIININKSRSIRIQEKEKREQLKYANNIRNITKEKLFWLGMGLYMAEGAKTGRWKSIFYNSDPLHNRIMMNFYRKICYADRKRIHIQLILHENISENKAKKYWSKILRLPQSHFNKASFVISRASKGVRPKNSLPFGTVQIAVGDKRVVNKIKGWTQGIERAYF